MTSVRVQSNARDGQVDRQVSQIATLVDHLHQSDGPAARPEVPLHAMRLAESRLGIASSLFTALKCKHAPTAAHSLRVALACSTWSLQLNLDATE